MRLDKFFSTTKLLSRTECQKAVKKGRITLNGKIVTDCSVKVNADVDEITLDGKIAEYKPFVYVMLNKPQGYVSATDDGSGISVLELLPSELRKYDLFPCGRLDKDTTGLLILTNDGQNAHRLLSPNKHVSKTYYFECIEPLNSTDVNDLQNGIVLKDGYECRPSKVELINETCGYITITEGKYHQIKRMFGAKGNKITTLKRISFGEILLDDKLNLGEYRLLSDKEEKYFTNK